MNNWNSIKLMHRPTAVSYLNLVHSQVEERLAVAHLNHTFGAHTSHRSAETAIQFKYGQFA